MTEPHREDVVCKCLDCTRQRIGRVKRTVAKLCRALNIADGASISAEQMTIKQQALMAVLVDLIATTGDDGTGAARTLLAAVSQRHHERSLQ